MEGRGLHLLGLLSSHLGLLESLCGKRARHVRVRVLQIQEFLKSMITTTTTTLCHYSYLLSFIE